MNKSDNLKRILNSPFLFLNDDDKELLIQWNRAKQIIEQSMDSCLENFIKENNLKEKDKFDQVYKSCVLQEYAKINFKFLQKHAKITKISIV